MVAAQHDWHPSRLPAPRVAIAVPRPSHNPGAGCSPHVGEEDRQRADMQDGVNGMDKTLTCASEGDGLVLVGARREVRWCRRLCRWGARDGQGQVAWDRDRGWGRRRGGAVAC